MIISKLNESVSCFDNSGVKQETLTTPTLRTSLLNFNLAEALCIFSIVHGQDQTSIAKYQFVSSGLLVSLSSALSIS